MLLKLFHYENEKCSTNLSDFETTVTTAHAASASQQQPTLYSHHSSEMQYKKA